MLRPSIDIERLNRTALAASTGAGLLWLLWALRLTASPGASGSSAVLIVALMLVAPFAEEIFFRVLVQRNVLAYAWGRTRLWGLSHANLATAAALCLLHLLGDPGRAMLFLIPGLLLGLLYERTRSVRACIALHAVFNALWLLLIRT